MWLKGQPYAPKSVEEARKLGIDTVFQDLALIDELSVYPEHVPAPGGHQPAIADW